MTLLFIPLLKLLIYYTYTLQMKRKTRIFRCIQKVGKENGFSCFFFQNNFSFRYFVIVCMTLLFFCFVHQKRKAFVGENVGDINHIFGFPLWAGVLNTSINVVFQLIRDMFREIFRVIHKHE